MREPTPRRGSRPRRRLALRLEGLETRELLSAVAAPRLPSYLAPETTRVRTSSPPQHVAARSAIDQELTTLLGPALAQVQQFAAQHGETATLGPAFVQSVLGRADTYQLLGSTAVSTLIGAEPAGVTGQSGGTITVTFQPEGPYLLGTSGDNSLVQVPPTGSNPGFIVSVPTAGIRLLPSGLVSIQVPESSVPAGIDPTAGQSLPTGSLTAVYSGTAQLIADALRSATFRPGPNTPRSVPGLRLASSPRRNRSFPAGAAQARFLDILHVAADRGVLNADPNQIQQGLTSFLDAVAALQAQGAFAPATPPAPPAAAPGRLQGTLQVSSGVVRELGTVNPAVSGLQLPEVGNFPGRLDVGYVVDRSGDYGLILTARGPLLNANPGVATADRVGGDIRVESSDAPSINALNGLRTVEGYFRGAATASGLAAGLGSNGVHTFASMTGYGSGLGYGTGVEYSLVIPLGNVYSLIPSAPRPS